ncbi:sulfatase-like hydrolase/transferase [Chitinophaga sp. MM2321]|uniref:sulfatase-like hydrolase/transferase n=1 Tax=Chitinophaga sp. MM2321 TaxID=3137178 RepID=UPI0032D5778B
MSIQKINFRLLIVQLCLIPLVTQAQRNTSAAKPNIIFILADDLGYETLQANGGSSYKTPQLNKMAQAGMRFTECSANPLCTPSRVQLMSGKYNFRNYKGFGILDPGETTFAHLLKQAGYVTAISGKWQLLGSQQQQASQDRRGHILKIAGLMIIFFGR